MRSPLLKVSVAVTMTTAKMPPARTERAGTAERP